jgi:hypothetical protein
MFSFRKNTTRLVFTSAALGLIVPALFACSGPVSPGTPATSGAAASSVLSTTETRLLPGAMSFTFTTLDNKTDPTFNQLLGINVLNKICGYYGSGAPGHPNKGYTLSPPYGQNNYTNENFPGSVQTQVTALNNRHDTAGFYVNAKGINFGFIQWKGIFTSYKDPHTGMGTVNQLLGLNDAGLAVGFYTSAKGVNHGYELNQATGQFTPIVPPGGTNVTASGINGLGDITGFFTQASGNVVGFLLKGNTFTNLSFPGSKMTTPFGINKLDQIVGSYVDNTDALHGFLLSNPLGSQKWLTVDDPNGIGATVVNGLNNKDHLVGFYLDTAGNTNGFLATPGK